MQYTPNHIITLTPKGKILFEKVRLLSFGRLLALLKSLYNGPQSYFNLSRYKRNTLNENIANLQQKGYVQVTCLQQQYKSTNVDLVNELTALNVNSKYNQLIKMATDCQFHCYKSTHDFPKLYLQNKLSQFPELAEISKRVAAGYFDEKI